ncbi:hypothetical protein [Leisingera sp. S232]|uniref:hypothetical protein n=1 Tax=Leisingera sp. S232 TaxID=3415132 RepID=UPI003C7A5823
MQGLAEFWVDFCNEVESTRKGNDTFLNALTEFAVSMVNDKTDPPWTPILNARSEASFLRTLTSKKKPDWKKVCKQDVKASRANNTGGKAFKKFIDQQIATAGGIVWKLEVMREVSFAVIETYMTARLVATKGMSPAKAHAIAAASTEVLKSSAGQLGEHLAGNKATWNGAAKKDQIAKYGTKATEDVIKLHGDAIYGEIAKQVSGKSLSKYAG